MFMFRSVLPSVFVALQWMSKVASLSTNTPRCRNQPGDAGFPSPFEWTALNTSVGGRLITVVPSAKFCHELPGGSCTEDQWSSTTFRRSIPGAMDSYNWEQDYLANPPELCLQNGTTCAQGNVPLYAVNASSAQDIQAGIKFATKYDIKVAMKASGHDYLGRSTAKNSLLIWTQYLKNITFTDNFVVNGIDQGAAITLGSGVPLNAMYQAAKAAGRMVVGGPVADVVVAGGYTQGAGHSAFSPFLGLAADNVLEFNVVLANGNFVTVNKVDNQDLFWAMRGGGAGSWGVIVSATVRTFPIFNATLHSMNIVAPTTSATGALMALHAKHIFDWDDFHAGGYFYLYPGAATGQTGNLLALTTYFPNTNESLVNKAMKSFIDDIKASPQNLTIAQLSTNNTVANDLMTDPDDLYGFNLVMGSRLIPAKVYKEDQGGIASAYERLVVKNPPTIVGQFVAGGKVAENANVSNAVTPKWRTAKANVIVTASWDDTATIPDILEVKRNMTTETVPILANLTQEPDSGAYSNEADLNEPDFQTTLFGPNYPRLLEIKMKYDPKGLFIVRTGVGSEEWDVYGLCRI